MDNRIRSTVARTLGVAPEEVDHNTSMATCAAWDSLRHFELILALEAEFRVRFRTDLIPTLTSVTLIEQALRSMLSDPAPV